MTKWPESIAYGQHNNPLGKIEQRTHPCLFQRDQHAIVQHRHDAYMYIHFRQSRTIEIAKYEFHRAVHADCSDRSHPSHIGFAAGDRIRMHLRCYYRAIGVFVYWLTESSDIESDNRHYSTPTIRFLPHSPSQSLCSPALSPILSLSLSLILQFQQTSKQSSSLSR